MAAFGGDHIKVTPEQVAAYAQRMDVLIKKIKKDFEEMDKTVSAQTGFWEGQAEESYRNTYFANHSEVEEALTRLGKIPGTLLSISGVYEQTENALSQMADILPDDIIF